MELKYIKSISFLALMGVVGVISGASRVGLYQGDEIKELLKFRKY